MFIFQAFIESKFIISSEKKRCGGSLISRYIIISAAHCFLEYGDTDVLLMPEFVEVTLGDHNVSPSISPSSTERTYRILSSAIEFHPQYDYVTGRNDLAKLYLDRPFDFARNPKIRPICLPTNPNEEYIQKDAKATGWGLMKRWTLANLLQEVDLQIISMDECNERLRNFHREQAPDHIVTSNKVICAYGERPKRGPAPRICRGRHFLH